MNPNLIRGREIITRNARRDRILGKKGKVTGKGGKRKEVFCQLLMIRQTHVEVQRFTLVYISVTKIRQEGS